MAMPVDLFLKSAVPLDKKLLNDQRRQKYEGKYRMISEYRDSGAGVQLTTGFQKGTWIHVENPTEDEIELLQTELDVPIKFLHAALDPSEVARTYSKHDLHLVIVRMPYDFGAEDRVPYRTVPLAMILLPNHFITICREPVDFVHDLNYRHDEGELLARSAGRMVLGILLVVGEWYLRYLEDIDRRLEDVEDRLKDSIENSEMLELLRYEKSLVYMKTGLQWNDHMVEHLQGKELFDWDKEDQELFEDVKIEYRQGYYMADTMLAVLDAKTDAFASLISNNLNVVMKFLTSVTIILTFPMLIASIYGMNVALPGQSHPQMHLVLLVISGLAILIVAGWFYRRGWLSFRWRRPGKR